MPAPATPTYMRPLMKSGPPAALALVSACAGNEATCTDVRAAMTSVLTPLLDDLGIIWQHYDITSPSSLPQSIIHALIVAPPSSTWSRSRHAAHDGPQALRSSSWPWGLPDIAGTNRDQVEAENDALRFQLKLIESGLRRYDKMTFALIAPEDRGAGKVGHPGSLWQLPELRRWARRRELVRGAVNQCEIGSSPTARPTGVLLHPLSSGTPPKNTSLRSGWPRLSPPPGRHYLGPLPRKCRCGSNHDESFTPSSNSPSAFSSQQCASWFARLLLRPHLRSRAATLGLLRKGLFTAQDGQPRGKRTQFYETSEASDSDTDGTWPEPSSDEERVIQKYEDMQLTQFLNAEDYTETDSISDATPAKGVASDQLHALQTSILATTPSHSEDGGAREHSSATTSATDEGGGGVVGQWLKEPLRMGRSTAATLLTPNSNP